MRVDIRVFHMFDFEDETSDMTSGFGKQDLDTFSFTSFHLQAEK